jgi:hypothetical protein
MQPCTNGSDEKSKRLYIVHSVHYLSLIHDTKPTKYTNFLRRTDYNITLNTPTCFGPQGIIIRESKQFDTALNQRSLFRKRMSWRKGAKKLKRRHLSTK